MVKSSWDDAYWIWNYDLLLYLEAIINIVGSYDAPPPPESMLVWLGGRYVLCAADIPTLIRRRGEIGIVPTLLTMIVDDCAPRFPNASSDEAILHGNVLHISIGPFDRSASHIL